MFVRRIYIGYLTCIGAMAMTSNEVILFRKKPDVKHASI